MGQFIWKYVASQPPQTVTLYHGDSSGHVLITLNSKVLIIDFKVKETKTYSFFIEEELCEVKITKENEQFNYSFEINKTAQTPHNEKRKKAEKKHLWQTFGFFAFGIVLVLASIFFFASKGESNAENFALHNELTVAVLQISEEENSYTYTIDKLRYENELKSLPRSVNGFPIQSGDEFMIKYNKLKPENHEFSFDIPSKKQIDAYRQRAITQQKKQAPQDSEDRAACLVDIAYEMRGISAFADFFFQNVSESKNQEHNENSYKRLIRSVEFQKKSKKCLSF